jgi:hypothetical protein
MKTRILAVLALLLGTWALGLAPVAHAADDFTGNWTVRPSANAGKVRFGLIHQRDGSNSQHQSDWATSVFEGLDLTTRGKRDVRFTITRDAGRFACEGFLNDAAGAGIFHFTPDAKFVASMKSLGFGGIDEEKQFAMAVHDVTVEFAQQMKSENLSGFDTDKLIAFRIFGVTREFIRELRTEGLPATNSDSLVAFRIHGVTPAMVREVRKAGLKPSEDQFIAMRIHGVTPEFIAAVERLGFQHPELDQLVAMRIHGVTPEFISNLKSRGMQNLTIDQLVNLRIHGID